MDASRGDNAEDEGGGRMHEEGDAARTPSSNSAYPNIMVKGKITNIIVYISSWNENPVLYFTVEVDLKINIIGAHILPGPKKCKLPGFFRHKEYFTIEVGLKLTSIGAHILPCP